MWPNIEVTHFCSGNVSGVSLKMLARLSRDLAVQFDIGSMVLLSDSSGKSRLRPLTIAIHLF